MNIYLWKEDIEDGASVMTVEYRPVEYGKDYDVVNNPDIFELYIDGKEVKVHTATFRGHQGRVLRPDRAILSGQS